MASVDLFQIINDIFIMVTSFTNKMYEFLNYRFTIPYAVWKPLKVVMDITSPLVDLPQTFSVLTILGGSFLGIIIVASVIKAVNFLT